MWQLGRAIEDWSSEAPSPTQIDIGLSTSCSATFWQLPCISSNFFCFEQLICILNNFSSYFLILTYRSSFFCLNWPFFHISQCFSTQFMNFLLKKGPNPPPWGRSWAPDRSSRARSAVFGENSKLWTKVFTWLTWVSRVKKVVQQFVFCIYFSNML